MRVYKVLLGFWLGVSVALHLALIFWLPVVGAPDRTRQERSGDAGASPGAPLHVFLVPVQAGTALGIAAQPADVAAATPTPSSPGQEVRHSGAPPDPRTDKSTDTRTDTRRTLASDPIALPLPYALPREDDYFRRAELTVPAEPLGQIDIPDPGPRVLPDAGSAVQAVVLTLLIGESGRVDRIIVETDRVPEALESAARKAFEQARFVPGQINGKPVKSRMRIEVRFEAIDVRR